MTTKVTAATVRAELTDDQLNALAAVLDTIVAKLDDKDTAWLVGQNPAIPAEQAKALAALSASTLSENGQFTALDECLAFIARTLNGNKRKDLGKVLSLLSSGVLMGALSQGKHWSSFAALDVQQREQLILGWQQSSLGFLRLLARTLLSLTMMSTYYALSGEPLHKAIGFPTLDPVRCHTDYVPPNGYPDRLPFWTKEEAIQRQSKHFDAIVIGSGAGGGVAAMQIAAAGKSVLVIEKGPYVHESEFVPAESQGFSNLYEKSSIFPSEAGNLSIMAGSVFGGSTTFTNDLEIVCDRIGASTSGIQHNGLNQVLLDGCKKLGYHHDDIPQNTNGQVHQCNYCFTGCKDGIKNSTMNSWLRDAKANGAEFVDKTRVVKVLVKNGRAYGVECLVHGDAKVRYHADRIVVSAGSLHSPSVLKRSGLKNKNIGQHLRVHPVAGVFGKFKDALDGFKGPIMTAISCVTENVDGDHFGAKLEVPVLHPGMFGAMMPWRGAKNHKDAMLNYRHYAPIIVLTRDKDSKASVNHDPVTGEVFVDFQLSKHDARSMMEGMVAAARVLVAAGAREVQTTSARHPVFRFAPDEPSDVTNPRFVQFLQDIRRIGTPDNVATAHLMGTCRMGVSPSNSVIKPTGETHEVKHLYVADASVLATATGVNPMVSTESVCLGIARHVVKSFTPAAKL
ncbi:hypothetical protein BC940DRAFT_246855 [Gongronella butleri]|nr:hypothetical protein BC940DRAFT_246855 [Gongronella butleri]